MSNMKTNQFIKLFFLTFTISVAITFLQAGEEKKFTEPIPSEHAKETSLCLKADSISEKDGYHTVKVRLINPTDTAISFTGYSEASPWYKIQRWVDGKWIDHPVGWFCGTGLRHCIIPSGQSSIIPVHVKMDLLPVRVGVEYSNGKKPQKERQIVWSKRIN